MSNSIHNDGFYTNLITNSTQDHVWSPFLMVYVVTAITISSFKFSPILNIPLHYRYSCECNCIIFLSISDIAMPYKSLWIFFGGFAQTQNSILLLRRAHFLSHLVLRIYGGNIVRTKNMCVEVAHIYIFLHEKEYFKLLVLLSLLFVHLFVHIRACGCSTQVGVEPV